MLRFGVIGIGRMGSVHADNLYKGLVEGATLTAVCDIDKSKTDSFCASHKGVSAYLDHRSLIDSGEVDAVIVATPHYSHVAIACYSVERFLHTVVEKPIAVTLSAARTLAETARKRSDTVVCVMYNQRTNPLYNRAKQLLDEGTIGKILRVNYIITDWYRTQAYYDQGDWRASWSGEGGGALINQCIHQLDMLQWLVGMPVKVFAECRTVNRNISVENEINALFTHKGFTTSFTASTHEIPGTMRLEIAGDKGKIVITTDSLTLDVLPHDESYINEHPPVDRVATAGSVESAQHLCYTVKDLNDSVVNSVGQHCALLTRFVQAVTVGADNYAPIEDGLNAVSLINAVYLSSWSGTQISLPFDENEYGRLLKQHADMENKK